MWHPIKHPSHVPNNRDVRLAVIDANGRVHALAFPCRRSGLEWVDAKSGRRVEVNPTHWQEWTLVH
jgi:hypothetical protein